MKRLVLAVMALGMMLAGAVHSAEHHQVESLPPTF